MDINDEILVEKIKNQDSKAMESAIHKYTDHLFKACLGLGFKKFEAEDIIQNVWITFFDVVIRFEGRSSLKTFLFGILYNKASEYRKQSNRLVSTENMNDIIDSYFDQSGHWILSRTPVAPDRFFESSENMGLIRSCLELLPISQKMAFILKEVEEEVTEQICNILDVTSTNLGVLLYRARNQLRDCIDRKSR